jgi:subtilisin family serine protease
MSCLVHALELVYEDVKAKLESGDEWAARKSVINLSIGISLPTDLTPVNPRGMKPEHSGDKGWRLYDWLRKLTNLGVVITVSAGNGADLTKPETLKLREIPSIWASGSNKEEWQSDDLPLIVS